jgi:molybdopterin-guanine dinucleotide biosynthesis protein A
MTAAVVLAGGRSRRFGTDKLSVPLADGRSVLAHAVAAAEAVADELIVVVAPGSSRPDGLPVRTAVVNDAEVGGGPLVGLAAGLEATSDGIVLVLGGDMPALDPSVLAALVAALSDHPDAEVARLEVARLEVARLEVDPSSAFGGASVLPCAVRRDAARRACREALAAGDRRLRGCLERLAAIVVPAAEWRALDPHGRTVLDVDRPGDLARLDRPVEPG